MTAGPYMWRAHATVVLPIRGGALLKMAHTSKHAYISLVHLLLPMAFICKMEAGTTCMFLLVKHATDAHVHGACNRGWMALGSWERCAASHCACARAGNDLAFADLVKDCLFFDSCVDELAEAEELLPGLRTRLVALLKELQSAEYAPNAKIMMTSYPYLVEEDGVHPQPV